MTIFKNTLVRSVSVLALGLCTLTQTAVASEVPGVDESNRYRLQMMTQIFDGARDFSHAQEAAIARLRKDGQSYTMMNFGDGAVFIETDGKTSAGNFANTSGVEAEFVYDYNTKTLSGSNQVSSYFNTHVRRYLHNNPALGEDKQWDQTVAFRDLGIDGAQGGSVKIELTRDYFTQDDRDYVLLHYRVPAFSYKGAGGENIIHWGEGISVSDPGFGEVYWNASLQRAVATGEGDVKRPYRYAKTIAATDNDGDPLFDPRKVDAIRPFFDNFYGATKTQVMGFVGGTTKPDQTPVRLAANLDVMALSIAEGSANESPQLSGQYTNGNAGQQVVKAFNTAKNLTQGIGNTPTVSGNNNSGSVSGAVSSVLGYGDKGAAVGGAGSKAAKEAIPFVTTHDPAVNTLKYVNELNYLADKTEAVTSQIETLAKENKILKRAIEISMESADLETGVINPATLELLDKAYKNSEKMKQLENQVELIGSRTETMRNILGKLPTAQLTEVMEKFSNSKGAKALSAFSHAMNINTIRVSGKNVYTAATTDLSSGDLQLTRSYGTTQSSIDLGLDIVALMANAYADPVAAVSDGLALGSSAIGDLYIVTKAKMDVDDRFYQSLSEGTRMRLELIEKQSQQRRAPIEGGLREAKAMVKEINDDLDSYDLTPEPWTIYHPNWDSSTNDWKPGTPQWKEKQSLVKRERRGEKIDWDAVNQRFYDSFNKDYPTVDPASIKKRLKPPKDPAGSGYSEIPDWLAQEWKELELKLRKQELDDYQKAKLERIREEIAARLEEKRQRIEDGKNNPIRFDPVDFDMPVWEPPEWEMPEWVPPEWTMPEFETTLGSIIDFTMFDGSEDDNWLGFANVMAYQYGDMSGTVATDLGPYEEFIAKYGLRYLERLADQAGYPNLASALADFDYLVGRASDQGFRAWANRAPVCYMACVNIQGQWTQKKSQLALGDLMLDSRDLFSTGGLTDVSIGSLLLTIFFRDFALEDGDAIRIVVSQFGREIFNSSFVLTNAGQSISVALMPGVAAVQITALNTGEFPPNTAAVSIEGVTDGESEQQYSLGEGEQGVLRVNTGRR